MDSQSFFAAGFLALTGNPPFDWQSKLFEKFLTGDIPRHVDLPTGTGKTALLYIWALALADAARRGVPPTIPRRLGWIVNRRVVVDQTTNEAENLKSKLEQPDGIISGIAAALSALSASGHPLAVSTLRGELADSGEWRMDPSCPAIIVGTVDMIGSRLLFSGYGHGRSRRAMDAGLLGHDTLLVHDEAQLTPAFERLLDRIAAAQSEYPRGVRVLHLTATHRNAEAPRFPESLDGDLAHPHFALRCRASKTLRFHPSGKDEVKTLCDLALAHRDSRARVIVFVRSPHTAAKVAEALIKKFPDRVQLLTGRIRGAERDALAGSSLFRSFLASPNRLPLDETIWLVSTSAGEVGANLDADAAVFDLTTAGSLIQRLGRVNRLGGREGKIDLVLPSKFEDAALTETVAWLQHLPKQARGVNVSPAVLRDHQPPPSALSRVPHIAELHEWAIDALSLTSLDSREAPVRSNVPLWLHGAEQQEPATYFAWRDEIRDLDGASVGDLEDVLEAFPILARERVEVGSQDAAKALELLSGTPVLVQSADGRAAILDAGEVRRLEYATVILPSDCGGLDGFGAFDSSRLVLPGAGPPPADARSLDVASPDTGAYARYKQRIDPAADGDPAEFVRVHRPGMRLLAAVRINRSAAAEGSEPELSGWWVFCAPAAPAGTGALSYASKNDVLLASHTDAVASFAESLCGKLGLAPDLTAALLAAAKAHDMGKKRPQWQAAAGNFNPDAPLAKTRRFRPERNGFYRHEFGSLQDALAESPFPRDAEEYDLALHLIASHHGWARPHFEQRAYIAFGSPANAGTALDAMRRFARLQRKYGPWGLAWLEAILKSADAFASSLEQKEDVHARTAARS